MIHHWQGFLAGEVETITSDYAAQAVLITPDGLFKGQALTLTSGLPVIHQPSVLKHRAQQ